jgi:hypothetical protein
MKKLEFIMAIVICLIISLPALSQEKISPSVDRCSKAKTDHLATEHEWSSLNADVSFIRDELERLRNLRWETKITLAVLDEALVIMKEKESISDTQLMALNSRIASKKGTIHPDGTFTISGYEGAPLVLDEAKRILGRLLTRYEENIKKTEGELKEKEEKSHLLSQRLPTLEEQIQKECKATGIPTPWEQGVPRSAEKDLYQRYMEKERMRQEEVESRRLADIERLWSREYDYPYLPPHPLYPP